MNETNAVPDSFADPFVDARASAVTAHEVARDVLRHLEETHGHANVAVVEPVSTSFPNHPLDTAVRDLAIATLAAARTAQNAWRGGVAEHAAAAGEAARSAARTLALLDTVAGSASRRADPHERVRVAHAAASTAFAAAELIRRFGDRRSGSGVRGHWGLPPSWQRLIAILSEAIGECERNMPHDEERAGLLNAARAAHDSAVAVRHAMEEHVTQPLPPAALLRFARVAALAAVYAGCAALVPLRAPEPC